MGRTGSIESGTTDSLYRGHNSGLAGKSKCMSSFTQAYRLLEVGTRSQVRSASLQNINLDGTDLYSKSFLQKMFKCFTCTGEVIVSEDIGTAIGRRDVFAIFVTDTFGDCKNNCVFLLKDISDIFCDSIEIESNFRKIDAIWSRRVFGTS